MTKGNWFTEGFGALIDDVRQKLVEEPWFGKTVTPASQSEPSLAKALGWAVESDTQHQAGALEPHEKTRDLGIGH